MNTVEIIPKDGMGKHAMIYDVEEYYCTEKMFYARQASGIVSYVSLDLIMVIRVTPDEETNNE